MRLDRNCALNIPDIPLESGLDRNCALSIYDMPLESGLDRNYVQLCTDVSNHDHILVLYISSGSSLCLVISANEWTIFLFIVFVTTLVFLDW